MIDFAAGDTRTRLALAGDSDQACEWISRGIASWPRDAHLRASAALALRELGDEPGADEQFQVALEIAADDDDFELRAEIGDLMARDDDEWQEHLEASPPPAKVRKQPRRKPSRSKRKRR